MRPWTQSPAFGLGLLSSGAGGALLLAALSSSARAGQDDEPAAATGRAAALAELGSPATGRACVCFHERVLSRRAPGFFAGDADERRREASGRDALIDRVRGVFLVETDAGPVVVWPAAGAVSFCEGWSETERSDGARTQERVLAPGALVTVRGRAGRLEDMMAAMAGVAAEQPLEVLRALQTRADLRALPCYWPNGGTFAVIEGGWSPEDERSQPFALAAAGAACLAMGALLLAVAWMGIV